MVVRGDGDAQVHTSCEFCGALKQVRQSLVPQPVGDAMVAFDRFDNSDGTRALKRCDPVDVAEERLEESCGDCAWQTSERTMVTTSAMFLGPEHPSSTMRGGDMSCCMSVYG